MGERSKAMPLLERAPILMRLFHRVALVLLREDVSGQGQHLDPATETPSQAPINELCAEAPSTARR